MAATNFTPIQLYYSTTASAAPSAGNLLSGELAINIADGKLFYKDSGGVVQTLATKGTGTIGGSTTQVQYNSGGSLAGSSNLTYDGTALTMGANPTLSAGTANGILYLNGSKVATSGSALTFDGTTLIAGAAGARIQVSPSTNTNTSLFQATNNGGSGYVGLDSSTGGLTGTAYALALWHNSNYPILFGVNNAEQMRLTSTGLGIGTSSPITKLSNTGTAWSGGIATDGLVWRSTQNDWTAAVLGTPATGAGYGLRVHTLGTTSSDYPLWVSSGSGAGSVLMMVNGSGDLGIGTSSPGQKLEVNGGIRVAGSAALAAALPSGVMSYESPVMRCYVGDGSGYSWAFSKRSASATTDLMTLLDSGNLGIGTASPSAKLTVSGGAIRLSDGYEVGWGDNSAYIAGSGATDTLQFITASTERMRLDSSGNLGIGVTPSAWRSGAKALQVGGFASLNTQENGTVTLAFGAYESGSNTFSYLTTGDAPTAYSQIGGNHRWYTAPSGTAGNAITFTQAMTLDAGGNLLVGTTDAAQTSGAGFKVGGAGGAGVGQVAIVDADSTNSTVTYRLYSTGAAAYRFYVGLGGTIYATNTTITAISDQRLKENIRDLDAGLSEVMALKPRKFDWKAGKGKDKKNDRGWVAQEFEQVFPDMVDTWQDPAPEGEEPYKAVNADLIPVLVKAMQEQQALITALTARVAQLERQS